MDRSQSREPLEPRARPAPPQAAAPGELPVPGAPPPRAALANAPAIPWNDAAPRARPTAPGRSSQPAAQPAPEPMAPPAMPDFAPAPPPPDLLGLPARP
jgi:hypothetical protein